MKVVNGDMSMKEFQTLISLFILKSKPEEAEVCSDIHYFYQSFVNMFIIY